MSLARLLKKINPDCVTYVAAGDPLLAAAPGTPIIAMNKVRELEGAEMADAIKRACEKEYRRQREAERLRANPPKPRRATPKPKQRIRAPRRAAAAPVKRTRRSSRRTSCHGHSPPGEATQRHDGDWNILPVAFTPRPKTTFPLHR